MRIINCAIKLQMDIKVIRYLIKYRIFNNKYYITNKNMPY